MRDPKKPRKLTRHGREMHCNICKLRGHTKKKCKQILQQHPKPATKRPRGRPRWNDVDEKVSSTYHHSVVAQPSNRGRGGNRIRKGRGGQTLEGRNKGRGRSNIRAGFGIYFNSTYENQYINTITNPINVSYALPYDSFIYIRRTRKHSSFHKCIWEMKALLV